MRKSFLFLFLVLLSLTISRGGGGGGSSSGGGSGVNSTPAISNLSISPNSAILNQGGGAITLTLTFNFIDLGGDLSTATIFYYDDANGNTISKSTVLLGVTGATSWTITNTMAVSTATRGSMTVGVYVTDSGGRESNQLTRLFTVIFADY